MPTAPAAGPNTLLLLQFDEAPSTVPPADSSSHGVSISQAGSQQVVAGLFGSARKFVPGGSTLIFTGAGGATDACFTAFSPGHEFRLSIALSVTISDLTAHAGYGCVFDSGLNGDASNIALGLFVEGDGKVTWAFSDASNTTRVAQLAAGYVSPTDFHVFGLRKTYPSGTGALPVLELYVDGNLVSSVTPPADVRPKVTGGYIRFGSNRINDGYLWGGAIDAFILEDGAGTPADMAAYAGTPAGGPGDPAQLGLGHLVGFPLGLYISDVAPPPLPQSSELPAFGYQPLYGLSTEQDTGTDISILASLNGAWPVSGGDAIFAEQLVRRLTTPRGSLDFSPDDGIDIRAYLREDMDATGQFAAKQAAENELQKDERVDAVEVVPQFDSPSSTLQLAMSVTRGTDVFRLVLAVTSVTAELLSAEVL